MKTRISSQTRHSTITAALTCFFASAMALAAPVRAQGPILRNMEITNLDVAYTSGTVLLQQLASAHATVAADGESLIGEDVQVRVHPPEGGDPIEIRSPMARYYFAAPPLPDLLPVLDPIEHLTTLRQSNKLHGVQPGLVDPVRGDFLLLGAGKSGEVHLDLGEKAALTAHNLIWSEKLQRFLTMSEFQQESLLPEGRLEIAGDAFIADREFLQWLYPVLGQMPVKFRFTPSGDASSGEGLARLAAGGELLFTVALHENRRPGFLRTSIDRESGNQQIEARGQVNVSTPELKMSAEALDYDPASGIMNARNNVKMKTSQLEASADRLVFDTRAEELKLSGNSRVLQEAEGKRTLFTGMDEFELTQQGNGERLVTMAGRQQFEVRFESAQTTQPNDPHAQGFGKLGSGMILQVSPGAKSEGTAETLIGGNGELSSFRADGSVVLTSDELNIRCDELMYDALEQRFEAAGNVFVQQTGIKADCARLVYDLANGMMTMTGNPDIIREEPAGTTHIWGCDTFIMETREDGSPDITATGQNCQSRFTPKAPAGDQPSAETKNEGGFLGQLSGGGEVYFSTGLMPDGRPGYFRITHNRIGEQIFEAKGDLELDTPEFKLRARSLVYNENLNRLTAQDNVIIRTPQIEADARDMIYNTLTQEVRLTGEPHVIQLTTENRSEFQGMEVFSLHEDREGLKQLELSGPREIQIDIRPLEQAGNTAAPPASTENRDGLQKLGDELNIVVSPHPEHEPNVRSIINETGELSTFFASGSIVLKSNRLDLRCDEMRYDSPTQRFEATGHVFVRQSNIQADCGRLLYELDSGRINLTLDPEVVQYQKDDIKTIQGCTEIVVQPREGGYPDILTKGENCQNFINPIEQPRPQTPPTAPQGAIEITPEQPTTVR